MAGAVEQVAYVVDAHVTLRAGAGCGLTESELVVFQLGAEAGPQLREDASCRSREVLFFAAYRRWLSTEDSVGTNFGDCFFDHVCVDVAYGFAVITWRHMSIFLQVGLDYINDFHFTESFHPPLFTHCGLF